MKTSSKMLFFSMMVMSTIMVMNSTNWISMWIGLEINLMSFIPLNSTSKNSFNSQSIMMYFLIQSMSSTMLLMMVLMYKYMIFNESESVTKTLITMIMMVKMGAPPFHMWFPEMMNKMSWMMCFILMTVQKISPMYIISLMIEMNKMLIMLICLTAMTGAVGGLNQTSTRKIMAYSSINHMSWMITCAATYKKSWIMYMMMYSLMMMVFIMMLYDYNILFINQMNIFYKNPMEKIIIITLMLSMGGMPPFLGFIPKWVTIQYMISTAEYVMMLVMMSSALITLSYYLKMSSVMNLITSHSQKWIFLMSTKKKNSMYLFLTNMLMPIWMLLMNFY